MKQNTRITIIIPTYNEEDNIGQLLDKIIKFNTNIVVVDDSSIDSTQSIVRKYQKKNKKIHLLTGPKLGLGVAIIRGYKYAILKLSPEIVVTTDADFAVDPTKIPMLINKINKGFDVALTSRHAKGGATKNWSFSRKVIHTIANLLFAKLIAGIKDISDLNSLTRAIRVKGILDKINFDNINVSGFGFLFYEVYLVSKLTNKIVEIPAVFSTRVGGSSKIRLKDAVEYAKVALRIRAEKMHIIKPLVV